MFTRSYRALVNKAWGFIKEETGTREVPPNSALVQARSEVYYQICRQFRLLSVPDISRLLV